MGSGGPSDGSGDEPVDARIGMVLQGRYRILACLGGGGMGTVYRGERLQLGRQVAVKFLNESPVRDEKILKRFEREAQAMSRLSHPNCVSVFDFGVQGSPYLVMDLIEGKTLRATMDEGLMAPSRALGITRQVLAGLSHAHAHGIVHRDIKPANIVLEQTPGLKDHVRILDFGLAKLVNRESELTSGHAIGTPNYMAPEQMGEGAVDERTDVYAVGILLFEMLTGKKPFDHEDVMQVFIRQLNMAPPPLRRARPQGGYSAALEAVLLRAMAKSQKDRFATAAAFAAALDDVPEAGSPAAAASSPDALAATMYAGARPEPARPTPARTPARGGPTAAVKARPAKTSTPPRSAISARVDPLARQVRGLAARIVSGAGDSGGSLRRGVARLGRTRKRRWVLVGLSLAAIAAALAAVSVLRHEGPSADVRVGPSKATLSRARTPPPARKPGSSEAQALLDRGDREQALRLLADLRRDRPDDAELAALQARAFFEKLWWSEGLAAYRVACRSDPARAADPVLVGHVISSLQSPRFHTRAEAFLREIGDPARSLLEKAARDHESPSVRARSASLLQSWR
jgi:serine/threonine-protein kinase